MKLREILRPEHVIPDLKSKTRDQVLSELLDLIAGEIEVPKERLLRVLIDRENQSSTAISGGVAVPHGRIPEMKKFILAVGRSPIGINFGAEDGPTRIFFLLMAPTNDTATHLKILARIARLCRNQGLREEIMTGASGQDIYQGVMKGDALI